MISHILAHELPNFGFGLWPHPPPGAKLAHKMPIAQRLMTKRGCADLVHFKEGFDVLEQGHGRTFKV